MRLFCVCVVLCVGSGLASDWSPIQGVLPSVTNDYRELEVCYPDWTGRATVKYIYFHRIRASRRRRWRGNPAPVVIFGPSGHWGTQIQRSSPEGWQPCSINKITVAKSREMETRRSNSQRNWQLWQNLLRKAMAQKDLFYQSQYIHTFHFSTSSRSALGPTQPPMQWVPGAPYPGVKWPARKAHHSPPTSVEVKNDAAIPPLSHVFMSWCLIKHRGNFHLLLQNFLTFYEIRSFITLFTRTSHYSVSWARSIQSIASHTTGNIMVLMIYLYVFRQKTTRKNIRKRVVASNSRI
jgi:hypothetical protein